MKRWIVLLLCGVIGVSMLHWEGNVEAASELGPVIGSPQLAVLVDGRKVKFQGGDPVMENNRVQVPLRGIGDTLGAKVDFSDKTVTYLKGEKSIVLTLGSKVAVVDGQNVTMDTAAKAVKGRTYVPLRFVSENLGESVSWDQVGGWVWIGEKKIPSTDDEQYRLIPISEFKEYTQSDRYFKKNGKDYTHIKIIKSSDLPIQLANSQIVYSINLVKRRGEDFIRIRSNHRGNPIAFLLKNSFAKGRGVVDNAFTNNGDSTGMNFYPIVSNSDKFQNGEYIENYEGWTDFNIKQADYILLQDGDLYDYAVVIENPFK